MDSEVKHFLKVSDNIDVSGVLTQIKDNPDLWDAHEGRTNVDSPHHGISDLWVRYRALEELTSSESFREPHFATFYPAWNVLTALHPIVFDLMAKTKAIYLGGVLITKIPPGGRVKPHNDRGSWHAETMNCKVYVGIQSNPQCVNYCEDESVTINAGDAVIFNNLLTHSVENNGTTDRITAIVCMRVEP